MTSEEIGRHRKALRVRKGLGLQELADAVSLSRGSIHKIESGEPTRETTLRAIASALGVTAAEYLGPDLVDDAPEPVRAAGGAS